MPDRFRSADLPSDSDDAAPPSGFHDADQAKVSDAHDLAPMRPVDPAQLRPRRRSWQIGLLVVSAVGGVVFAGLTVIRGTLSYLDQEFRCMKVLGENCEAELPAEVVFSLLMVIIGFGLALALPKRTRWSWVFVLACLVVLLGPMACFARL